MIAPDTALVACRFAFFGAAMFLWGSNACLAFVMPDPLARKIATKLRIPFLVAVLTLVVATVLLLPFDAASIGDGWPSSFDRDTLLAVLFETDTGRAWMAQAAAAVVLSVAAVPHGRMKRGRMAIAAGLALATLPISGHAAMSAGALGIFHRANDMIHVLAAGAWIGALVPVLLVLSELRRTDLYDEAMQALARFSAAGHVAVAATIGTGLVNTWLVLGTLPLDWSAPYQLLLSLKIGLVATMVALALTNRYIFVPRSPRALPAFVASTVAEIVLAAAILFLVAWFGILDPSGG